MTPRPCSPPPQCRCFSTFLGNAAYETLSSAWAAQTSWVCSCFRFPRQLSHVLSMLCKSVTQVTQDGVETKSSCCAHTRTRVLTHTLPQTKGPILRRGHCFYALTGSAGWSLRRSDRFPIFTLSFHIPSFRTLAFIIFLILPAFSSRHSRCRCETGRNRTHLLCNLLREQELWGV